MSNRAFTRINDRSVFLRYEIAVLLVAAAASLRLIFLGALGNHVPYAAFYPAVTIAALFCGVGPGLLAGLLSSLAAWFLWVEPEFSAGDSSGALALLALVLNSIIVSLVCGAFHRAYARAEDIETKMRIAAEREQADESIRAIKVRFDQLAEQTRTLIWEVNAEGLYTHISPASEAVIGYRPEEVAGCMHFYDLHPESGRQSFKKAALKVFKRREPFQNLENAIQAKDGRIIWVSTSGVPLVNDDGTLKGYWGTDTDITDRKRAENDLIGSEERLHAALDQGREGVVIAVAADAAEIVYWNPAARAMHGVVSAGGEHITIEEILKKFQLLAPDRSRLLPFEEWPIPRIIRGESVQNLELRLRHTESGRERLISHSGTMLETASGEHLIFLFLHDLTAQREAEDALLEASRKKDEFLAVLAHELRNPMAAISAAAAVMSRPEISADKLLLARDALARRVTQLGRLIDDLLDVSRIARGKIELRKEHLDLELAIVRAVDSSKSFFDDRGQQLAVRILDPLPVYGDPVRLEQIVSNLLTNASRYSNEGQETTLTALREGSEAVVRVKDSGIGIPAFLLPRLFEPFMQAENSLERTKGGLGLGLAIVKNLCELHGGKASAKSEGEGRGSEFEIRLPIGEAHSRGSFEEKKISKLRALNILVAEDHLDTAMMMASVYESEGHTVEIAGDGPSAVRKAVSMKPDVILLDIGLPGFSGYQVAEDVRRAGLTDTLIIAVTGYGQEQDIKRAQEAGIDEHLLKPVDLERLRSLFSRCEDRKKTLHAVDA